MIGSDGKPSGSGIKFGNNLRVQEICGIDFESEHPLMSRDRK